MLAYHHWLAYLQPKLGMVAFPQYLNAGHESRPALCSFRMETMLNLCGALPCLLILNLLNLYGAASCPLVLNLSGPPPRLRVDWLLLT